MTQTLRSLIEANDFTGYPIENAADHFTPDDIEQALYGAGANNMLNYDLIDIFAKAHPFEIIPLVRWLCTDTHVGLSVLRLDGKPIAVSWQAARRVNELIHFISGECLEEFRAKWEAVKGAPETEADVLHDEVLDLPIAAPGAPHYEIDGRGRGGMARLTETGIEQWLEAQGGIEAIEDPEVLARAATLYEGHIEENAGYIADLFKGDPNREALLSEFTRDQDMLCARKAQITARAESLTPAG